jgi:hypothetical protein
MLYIELFHNQKFIDQSYLNHLDILDINLYNFNYFFGNSYNYIIHEINDAGFISSKDNNYSLNNNSILSGVAYRYTGIDFDLDYMPRKKHPDIGAYESK